VTVISVAGAGPMRRRAAQLASLDLNLWERNVTRGPARVAVEAEVPMRLPETGTSSRLTPAVLP
jgi:hypothetical protein